MLAYRVKVSIVVSGQSSAEALQRVQDRIEPKSKAEDNGMYLESVDKIEPRKGQRS